MEIHDTLFDNNRAWAEAKQAVSHDFFQRLADGQSPPYLWIGCSDSRVAPNLLLDKDVGEVFVQRNVANQIQPSDDNTMAAVEYAVTELQVPEIIVCGHYNCGGVTAALTSKDNKDAKLPHVHNWLGPVRELAAQHTESLEQLKKSERAHALSELNMAQQVKNLLQMDFVMDRWRSGKGLLVRGLMFDLASGKLLDMGLTLSSTEQAHKFLAQEIADYCPTLKPT